MGLTSSVLQTTLRIGLLSHLQNVGHSIGQYNIYILAAVEFLAEYNTTAFLLLYSFEIIHSELQFNTEL